MLQSITRLLGPRVNPIGVDFGTDSLKMAQTRWHGGEAQLIAAASADIPSAIRHDPAARMQFFSQTVRELLAQGGFRGRRVVIALPAAGTFLAHVRVPKCDGEALTQAVAWEARGKLPIDVNYASLRHYVAGEVYTDGEPIIEVILIAASRETVRQILAAADKAKLEIAGLNVEPMTIVECFAHVYRRQVDAHVVNCFVDIGASASRAIVAQGGRMLFARTIAVGADHFNRAAAAALKIPFEEAKLLRIRMGQSQFAPAVDDRRQRNELVEGPDVQAPVADGGTVILTAPPPRVVSPAVRSQRETVDQACAARITQLTEELDLCRRYYESAFPSKPVERLIFVGGEARQRGLCQQIAQQLGLAAQVGDPLVRMGRTTTVGPESGLDRREPQPGWVVAVGLSLGAPPDALAAPSAPRKANQERTGTGRERE